MASLSARAWFALAALAAVLALLLFVPAGTMRYWQAWLYLSIFFGASLLTTRHLMRTDPALLQRRMSGGPTAEQRLLDEERLLARKLSGYTEYQKRVRSRLVPRIW